MPLPTYVYFGAGEISLPLEMRISDIVKMLFFDRRD